MNSINNFFQLHFFTNSLFQSTIFIIVLLLFSNCSNNKANDNFSDVNLHKNHVPDNLQVNQTSTANISTNIFNQNGIVSIKYIGRSKNPYYSDEYEYNENDNILNWDIMYRSNSDKYTKTILESIDRLRNGDCLNSRKELLKLKDASDPFTLDFYNNFQASTYMCEEDYYSALGAVAKKYKDLPKMDLRYRWEIAYVIYLFRKSVGLDSCEIALAEIKKKYKRDDLSPVWMAISPKANLRLLSSELYPNQWLDKKQLDILRYVVRKYRNDPFIDHAYYFLHEYDTIIQKHPKSIILDRAYYAKAFFKYYSNGLDEIIPGTDIYDTNNRINTTIIIDICNDFISFLKRFPNSRLSDNAIHIYCKCCLMLSPVEKGAANILNLISYFHQLNDDIVPEWKRTDFINTLKDSFYDIFTRNHPYKTEHFLTTIPFNELNEIDSNDIKIRLAYKWFELQNYEKSFSIYSQIPNFLSISSFFKINSYTANRIDRINKSKLHAKDKLLKIAIELKTSGYYKDAILYLNKCLQYNDSPKDKIYILLAFCYRDLCQFRNMINAFKIVAEYYPKSKFADDALAELGYAELFWHYNSDSARVYFMDVVNKYPKRNAADNSHYLMVKSYLMENNDTAAIEWCYKTIRRFPYTRFARYAFTDIIEIKGLFNKKLDENLSTYIKLIGRSAVVNYRLVRDDYKGYFTELYAIDSLDKVSICPIRFNPIYTISNTKQVVFEDAGQWVTFNVSNQSFDDDYISRTYFWNPTTNQLTFKDINNSTSINEQLTPSQFNFSNIISNTVLKKDKKGSQKVIIVRDDFPECLICKLLKNAQISHFKYICNKSGKVYISFQASDLNNIVYYLYDTYSNQLHYKVCTRKRGSKSKIKYANNDAFASKLLNSLPDTFDFN